jgi:transposase
MHLTATSATSSVATVAVDVSACKLNLMCRELSSPGASAEWEIANRTGPITSTLLAIRERAQAHGITALRVVVEPTGIYHKLLLRIAAAHGFETGLVDAGHVKKMRSVLFGDDGKTDRRDPYAIEAVAAQGRLITDRRHDEVYSLLRQWGKIYSDSEAALIDAKSRVHRALTLLFPDFDFTTDFLYGPSGQAIVGCFGLDPHVIATLDVTRIHKRLRKHSRILRSSVVRLLAQACQTVAAVQKSRVTDLQARDLAFAWEDFELAERRRQTARQELEALYDEARIADPLLPDAVAGSVVSKAAMARLLGEAGPLSAYSSWRQLLRMAGANLRERKSGKYVGQTRIARTGRPLLRAILNQMALPLVKRDRLFGPYYHHKISVQKMPGAKAMTAVSRKIVKMIWGWYRSGQAFDVSRVFTCAGQFQRAA